MPIKRILLDMDGPLVDFVEGAARLFGWDTAELLPYWNRGDWSMVPALSAKQVEWSENEEDTIDLDRFWKAVNRDKAFWRNLPEASHAKELMYLAQEIVGDSWAVITDPALIYGYNAYAGKAEWLRKNLHFDFSRYIPTHLKEWLANPNTVLIDDSDANVNKFREAGGKAIVFPCYWNSQHEHMDDPMTYVRGSLMQLNCNLPVPLTRYGLEEQGE